MHRILAALVVYLTPKIGTPPRRPSALNDTGLQYGIKTETETETEMETEMRRILAAHGLLVYPEVWRRLLPPDS
jgi:hypothetical protein